MRWVCSGSDDWKLHEPSEVIDAKDADTPDNWIPRHPSILRLTGRHPLNCEPPMDLLMASGFITPASLHLVGQSSSCISTACTFYVKSAKIVRWIMFLI